ncbi:MAG: protein phosphatase 2C domain-containing protein [Leptolyngbyaceae cyanobacterium]
MINCFNPNCQAENPLDQAVCRVCHWPLVKRYLWAVGSGARELRGDRLVNERYQLIRPQLLLDTKPSRSPLPLEAAPELAQPYLALSPFTTAIPRPFAYFTTATGAEVLLLEDIPVGSPAPKSVEPPLLPTLAEAWSKASALHQLAWLWHWATLWEPAIAAGVGATLLQDDWLRVEGADLRLLALTGEPSSPSLSQLGDRWQSLLAGAQPVLQTYLPPLLGCLQSGNLSAAALTQSLLRAIETLTQAESRSVHSVTYSDQGPPRQRNEDACYPPSGTRQNAHVQADSLSAQAPAPMVVVCDGIGGHQGGDVASKLAIETVTAQLQAQLQTPNLSHEQLQLALEQAILQANQQISEQNDQAHREARDRMGTTLVMAVAYGARLYLAHLGASRAYRIRPYNCRQLTLDDDVATRNMRLGLSLYRDALLNPGSGSLVQALGMADSRHLHPTVQMHLLVEDTLILICSDGLSDNDLVERLWSQELAPLLGKPQQTQRVGQRLIQLANTHNGHDNVTVGLLHLAGQPSPKPPVLSASLALVETVGSPAATATVPPPTRITPARRRMPWLALFSGLVVAAFLGAAGAYIWRPSLQSGVSEPEAAPEDRTTLSPSAAPPQPAGNDALEAVEVGDVLQLQRLPVSTAPTETLAITAEVPPAVPNPAVDQPKRPLPVGSHVEVVRRQKTPDNQLWVRLRVCSVLDEAEAIETSPSTSAELPATEPALPWAKPGEEGWILEETLRQVSDRLEAVPANTPCS